jgi:hypothetical protein
VDSAEKERAASRMQAIVGLTRRRGSLDAMSWRERQKSTHLSTINSAAAVLSSGTT